MGQKSSKIEKLENEAKSNFEFGSTLLRIISMDQDSLEKETKLNKNLYEIRNSLMKLNDDFEGKCHSIFISSSVHH